MKFLMPFLPIALIALFIACNRPGSAQPKPTVAPAAALATAPPVGEKLELSDAEWKKRLTEEQYQVLRESGTERAFTGAFWKEKHAGLYVCAACGAPLFESTTKFDSGTGWPSFTSPVQDGRVANIVDDTHGMKRTEVRCARCGGHLGHVFDDGPAPTGLRYCINSASLDFHPEVASEEH